MLAINNQEKFNQIVKEALAKSSNFPRWQNAINKAVVQIELNGDFMHFDTKEAHLVIWSQGSDEVYTSNGVCQCKAFTVHNVPCWHRAAARLVRTYLGLAENTAPNLPGKISVSSNAPYLKQSSGKAPITVGRFRI